MYVVRWTVFAVQSWVSNLSLVLPLWFWSNFWSRFFFVCFFISQEYFLLIFRFVTLFIRCHSSTSRHGPSRSPDAVFRSGSGSVGIFDISLLLPATQTASRWDLCSVKSSVSIISVFVSSGNQALHSDSVLIRNRFLDSDPSIRFYSIYPDPWMMMVYSCYSWTLRPSGWKCRIRTVLEAGSQDRELDLRNRRVRMNQSCRVLVRYRFCCVYKALVLVLLKPWMLRTDPDTSCRTDAFNEPVFTASWRYLSTRWPCLPPLTALRSGSGRTRGSPASALHWLAAVTECCGASCHNRSSFFYLCYLQRGGGATRWVSPSNSWADGSWLDEHISFGP